MTSSWAGESECSRSAASILAATAIVNRRLAEKAERDNPPQGRFIELDGVREPAEEGQSSGGGDSAD